MLNYFRQFANQVGQVEIIKCLYEYISKLVLKLMLVPAGCPKLTILQSLGILFFKGGNNTHIKTINMHLLIQNMYNVNIQCHESYNEVELKLYG